jgi:hypothetical protein
MNLGSAAKLAEQCDALAAQIKPDPLTSDLIEIANLDIEKAKYGIPLGISLYSQQKKIKRYLEKM